MPDPASGLVNRAILDALRDAEDAYNERGILVTTHLDATAAPDAHEPVLYQALYTIFRGLPMRLVRGATLLVSTVDRAGGDIELLWEAREPEGPLPGEPTVQVGMRHGPYGDLLELAVAGLQEVCRVRTTLQEEPAGNAREALGSLLLAPHVRRRYMFLVPGARRL